MDVVLTALAAEARRLAALGFMACTGGNLSVRLSAADAADGLRIAVSASGLDKATLRAEDFIPVGADGKALAGDLRKPSDETGLHLALYAATAAGCICHGHPPHAVTLSLAAGDAVRFRAIEMMKAFAGTSTHACERVLPVIDNSQDMAELARRAVAARDPHVPAVLVRGHGVYAWGRTVPEAGRHLETVDWLCRIHLLARAAHVDLP
jgi:methylthioribulose-1-phosphate dehydratase